MCSCRIFVVYKKGNNNNNKNLSIMATIEERISAYNEAKSHCETYKSYNGDKRKYAYKLLQRNVIELWMPRMNSFGRSLGIPTFDAYFYGDK